MLGPESVAWRVIGHPVSIVGGLLRAAVPPAAAALRLPLLRDAPSLVLGPESHELGRQARRRLAEAA